MIHILQSTVERLLYTLLGLVFVAIIVLGTITYHIEQELKTDVNQIETEQNCIAAFFLQGNRSALTIKNLKQCQPVVQKVE